MALTLPIARPRFPRLLHSAVSRQTSEPSVGPRPDQEIPGNQQEPTLGLEPGTPSLRVKAVSGVHDEPCEDEARFGIVTRTCDDHDFVQPRNDDDRLSAVAEGCKEPHRAAHDPPVVAEPSVVA